ncbi:TPA: hypothetical protein ACPVXH_004552, partial [Vibrio parahaemolyticus]
LEPLLDLQEVPISPRESWSLVVWPDGEIKLLRHEQRKFREHPLLEHMNLERLIPEAYITHELLEGTCNHAYY